jgi:hypothetical protein
MDVKLKKKLTVIEKHTNINELDHAIMPISKIEIISYIDEILLELKKQK